MIPQILVSVVMPAYRCRDTITAAVESALAQDVALEILIVDDASPDNLTEVLADYAGDERVRILQNPTNVGPAVSRNRGIAAARGKYVAFLDADDLWAPGKLKKQLQLLEETGVVMCATARELMTADGRLTGRILPVRERITFRSLLRGNSIGCSSVVLRRDVAVRFPMTEGAWHEDYRLWLEILGEYGDACGVNDPLLKYRMTRNGRSGTLLHSAGMTWRVYRASGFSAAKSALYFIGYALSGMVKYGRSYFGGWK